MTAAPVFVVDDDEAVRDSLAALLGAAGFEVTAFGSADEFLAAASGAAGCLVADVRMPGMDGLELQTRLRATNPELAVVIMTGHADVPLAVRALKAGAVDFVEKPFEEEAILGSVRAALSRAEELVRSRTAAEAARARLRTLTAREREVLDALVAGHPNKVIAHLLGISPRTVEIHRARVMDKMGVDSLPRLVRAILEAGGDPPRRDGTD